MWRSHALSPSIPEDIWLKILDACEVKDILSLQQTCKPFLRLTQSRHVWLNRLCDLDQEHAPDLPAVFNVERLSTTQVKNLVVRSAVMHENSRKSVATPISEICIPVGNNQGRLGDLTDWGCKLSLTPGGRYLFVKWSSGYLQCWDVSTKESIWMYPPSNLGRETWVREFDQDLCENGDVHVLVVSSLTEPFTQERIVEIFRLSAVDKNARRLFKAIPREVSKAIGSIVFAKLCHDIVTLYLEGRVFLMNWRLNHAVMLTNVVIDAMKLTRYHLIIVQHTITTVDLVGAGKSLSIFSLKHLQSISEKHTSKRVTPSFPCDEVLHYSSPVQPQTNWLINSAILSVCTFPWKKPSSRDAYVIQVLADVFRLQDERNFPVLYTFRFHLHESKIPDPAKPRLEFVTCTEFSEPFGQEFTTYSMMTSLTQNGSAVIAFHTRDRLEALRTLAQYSRAGSAFRRINFKGRNPSHYSVYMEFYSGALYFPTDDSSKLVIQYFDR